MTISRKEVNGLMSLIGLTKDKEIDCDQCLSLIAEFAEQNLTGKSITDGLKEVEQHISICKECNDEYEVLKQALKHMND